MKIIKFVKKGKANYNLILENNTSLTLNEEVIIKNNLIVNKDLNDEIIKKLLYENNIEELYSKCIKFISIRLRSKTEIINYLSNKKIDKNIINIIVEKLEKAGYINDDIFAKCYINDKINLTLEGPYKIKKELEENHIDNLYIENALNHFTQNLIDEKIEKIINKKIKSNTKDTEYIFKQKLSLYLSNLGYSKEDINNHLETIKIDNSKLEKEMEKIYNKLKLKYEGYNLKTKLKQKLYLKGFTSEEINDFIEKTVH